MTATENTRERVREVVQQIGKRRVYDDELLISSGLIDSLSILTLIGALEKQLNIVIPKNQVQPDDFDSIQLILETIGRVAVPR